MYLTEDAREELRVDIISILYKLIEIYKTKGQNFFLENVEHSKSFISIMDSVNKLMVKGVFVIRDLNIDYKDFITIKLFAEMMDRNISIIGGEK